MAIENSNPVNIAGTSLQLETTFIIGTHASIVVSTPYEKQVDIQLFVYQDVASWLSSPVQNRIVVAKLAEDNHCKFVHNRLTDGDIDEFTDNEIKAKLLTLFSEWDADLLTFQPAHEIVE